MLVTYTISTYVKTEKIATTPKTLSFCCSRWGVECEKKKCIYQALSLSLSLSLSLLRWRREWEERLEGVGPGWVQPPRLSSPATQATICPYSAALYYAVYPTRRHAAEPAGHSNFFFLYITYYIFKSLHFVQMRVTLKNDFERYFFFSLDNHPLS